MNANSTMIRKTVTGAAIAGAGAALVYLSAVVPGLAVGEHGALWGAIAATLLNAARQALRAFAAEQGVEPPQE